MTAQQYHHTTVYDLFKGRYEVLKPLITFATSNDEPYVFDNSLELMSVFTSVINTDEGRVIVQKWYCVFAAVLVDLGRLAPRVEHADERTVSLAYHSACIAIEALAKKLTHVLLES